MKKIQTVLICVGAGIWSLFQWWIFGVCALLVLGVAANILSPIIDDPGAIYVTDDIADYGIITGNYDNDGPEKFLDSFFPAKIDQEYSDVEYYYRAQKDGDYNFEAYLEFTVPDKECYDALVESIVGEGEVSSFTYDPQFSQYVISDGLVLERADTEAGWRMISAWFGRVLFSEETQTVIYVAIGYRGDANIDMDGLDFFFTKYEIDPAQYATVIVG